MRALHTAVNEDGSGQAPSPAWQTFTELCNGQEARGFTLRSLLEIAPGQARMPVPLDDVEPEEDILRHFVGAAISYGAISDEAHRTLAEGCNACGVPSNCGEGGEDPARNTPGRMRTAVAMTRAPASARSLRGASVSRRNISSMRKSIQIKAAQGAKPGEGGQLPAYKVTVDIARVRATMPGVSLVSPAAAS